MNNLNLIGNSKRISRFDPELARKLTEEYEKEQRKKKLEDKLGKGKTAGPPIANPQDIPLEDLQDFWRISNVPYRNGLYRVDLAKELLDNGTSHTQDEWAEYSIQAQHQDKFHVADFPLYHALFTALKSKNDTTSEEARDFIKQQMKAHYLMTLTRVRYNPKPQKDAVMHDYKQQDQYTRELDSFMGPDGFITGNIENILSPLQSLLDTKQSVEEINSVYQWLTGVNAYIWRVNNEVPSQDERVARFGAVSDRASLFCYGGPSGSDHALGVRRAKK